MAPGTQKIRSASEYGKLGKYGMRIIKLMFGIFLCISFGYFFVGEMFLPADSPSNYYDCEEFISSWTQVFDDGTRRAVDIPGKCEGDRGDVITIETTLPETIERDKYLCFRSSKQDMRFYVDGQLRMEYSTNDTRIFGKTTAVAYVFVEIMNEDAGKILRVETESDSAYSGIIYSIYYGDKMGIWYSFFEQHGAELLIAFLALLLGVLSIIGSVFLDIVYHRQVELKYLGWSVVVSSVWIIANSVFRQVIFPNISTINDMTFYMVMLMPFPFLIYMNEVQKYRYVKVYFIVGLLAVVDFLVCTPLHMLRIVDFADTIKFMAVACLFTVLTLLITIAIDIKRGLIWQYFLVAVGIFGACLAAVVQFANYFARAKEFDCSVLAVGLIFLLLISMINTVKGILNLESEKQQAILQSAAKATFLANMSHEIRTPINAILGMDEMILRENKDRQIREYALDIHNAGQGLLSIINDILDLSKIESGKMEIIPVDYDFSSVIHDVVNMVREKAKDKGLTVNVILDHELPARYYGDEVRLRQILLNLLNNAVKYTEEGSVTLEIEGKRKDNDSELMELSFSVNDTGIGIKEEDLEKLFAKYERIEEARNRNIEGTGLGMNITVTLLQLMGSELDVESEYGKGSSFSFVLEQPITDHTPIGNLEERIREQAVDFTYNVSFTAPDAWVLVVDDNSVNRKVFRSLLKLTAVNIDEADSGQECLDMVSKRHYDIIFLDHMMPEMDGVETLQRMKEMEDNPCEDTPVVALTANAISGAKEMYLELGFDKFLSKPIVPERLEKMIAQLLPDELIVHGGQGVEESAENLKHISTAYNGKAVSLADTDDDPEKKLPDITGIDWDYALMHLLNEEVLREMVEAFYNSIEHDGDFLYNCYKELAGITKNDVDHSDSYDESNYEKILSEYRVKVHAMKSSAAAIGAMQLSGLAQLLENLAKEGNTETILALTPAFLEEWYEYKEKLACMIPEKNNASEPAKPEVVVTYLNVLKGALDDMDLDMLDSTMEELMGYAYSDKIQGEMKELKIAVDNLEEDRIEELIKGIKEEMYEKGIADR
ncbi:MAG: response regulator [Lachnospiraceae bacterium]|nr:response regulator [Lachnospiraceae bacterium]